MLTVHFDGIGMSAMNRTVYLPNETLLISSAIRGELDAFNQLVLAYQDLAYNHALALLRDSDQAEDVTQESFIKAFQKIGQFGGGSFRAWLLSIVTHNAYDHLRRSKRHPITRLIPEDDEGEDIESPSWMADPAPSVADQTERKELSQAMIQSLNELPKLFRSILVLVDVNGLDYSEASTALNIPKGTVRSRLARARMHMRKKLMGDESPADFGATLAGMAR